VEMEATALATVAAFRGVPLAHVLYGGDDLSGETWDHRSWQSQTQVLSSHPQCRGSVG
jgi:uridine phosphorylase